MPFLVFFSALLAVVVAGVVSLNPGKTPKERAEDFSSHQSLPRYIEAQKMIVPLLPAPVAWWSAPRACAEAGNGIWLAEGVVALQVSTGEEIPTQWTAIFIPGNPQPLYLRLGQREVGDRALALGQAEARAHKD